jgi:hypothetical protein
VEGESDKKLYPLFWCVMQAVLQLRAEEYLQGDNYLYFKVLLQLCKPISSPLFDY